MKIHPFGSRVFPSEQIVRQKSMDLATAFQNFAKGSNNLKFVDLSEMCVYNITLYSLSFQITVYSWEIYTLQRSDC
jgi:hypothetical protein